MASESINDVEIESNIDEIFDAAVEIVHNMPKEGNSNKTSKIVANASWQCCLCQYCHNLVFSQNIPESEGPLTTSNSKKLAFYALYKQATNGPCNVPRPAFWNIVEKYKWDAWNRLENMDKQKAKTKYVQKMRGMIDKVLEQYDVTQWMHGDQWDHLEPLLRPKFKLIGRDLFQSRDSKTQISHVDTVENQAWEKISLDENKSNERTSEQEESPSNQNTNLHTEESVLSDDEYTDADELPPTSSVSSKLSLSNISRSDHEVLDGEELTVSVLQKFLVHFQSNVNLLTQHFHSITTNLMKQNQIIATLLANMPKRYRNGMSWKTTLLFILWPIIVNVCMYYILKRRYFIK